jgi:hypothetical protein
MIEATMTLVELRKSLNDFQKELLQSICETYLKTEKGIVMRVLHSKHGKQNVVKAFADLGGSIVYEVSDHEKGNRYEPAFLGLMLCPKGQSYEDLLVRFMEYQESLFLTQPERDSVDNREIEDQLGLNHEESLLLYKLAMKGNLWGSSASLNSDKSSWRLGIFRDVDDLPSWPSKREFLHENAMGSYDPQCPVYQHERERYMFNENRSEVKSESMANPTDNYDPQDDNIAAILNDKIDFIAVRLEHLAPLIQAAGPSEQLYQSAFDVSIALAEVYAD